MRLIHFENLLTQIATNQVSVYIAADFFFHMQNTHLIDFFSFFIIIFVFAVMQIIIIICAENDR